jgi:hypothetical protein
MGGDFSMGDLAQWLAFLLTFANRINRIAKWKNREE